MFLREYRKYIKFKIFEVIEMTPYIIIALSPVHWSSYQSHFGPAYKLLLYDPKCLTINLSGRVITVSAAKQHIIPLAGSRAQPAGTPGVPGDYIFYYPSN